MMTSISAPLSPCVRARPSGPSRSSGMWISASHRLSSTGAALKLARAPNCTSSRSRTFARPMPMPPTALPGAMVLSTRSIRRSSLAYASTRMVTGPSWPASPCTTAFSTSGCRIRLGTQARARSSCSGTRIGEPVGEALLLQLQVQRHELQLVLEARELRSPAVSSRRSRSPSCTTMDCAAGGSQVIWPRMVCSRLKSVCGESCMRSAARCAWVSARSRARGAQLRIAQALVEGEAHDERQPEGIGHQEVVALAIQVGTSGPAKNSDQPLHSFCME